MGRGIEEQDALLWFSATVLTSLSFLAFCLLGFYLLPLTSTLCRKMSSHYSPKIKWMQVWSLTPSFSRTVNYILSQANFREIDWWSHTLPSHDRNAADRSLARVRGALSLLPSGRRRGPKKQDKLEIGPCFEGRRIPYQFFMLSQVHLWN